MAKKKNKSKKNGEPTLRELLNSFEKQRKKGYKPHLKGKKGTVKIEYD